MLKQVDRLANSKDFFLISEIVCDTHRGRLQPSSIFLPVLWQRNQPGLAILKIRPNIF